MVDVYRVGSDQALRVRGTAPEQGTRVEATVGHFAARDDAQPHRHPPAPRGAARAARHPCAPGRLGRAPRQAALRLHPRRPRSAPTSCARSDRVNEWVKAERPVRAIEMDRGRGRAARRDGPVRREVRRLGPGGRGRRASPASSAAGPTSPTPPRSGSSRSSRRARAHPTCAGSRRSPDRPRSTCSGSAPISWRAGAALGGGDDPAAAAERMATRLRELEAAAAERDAEAAGNRAAELSDSAEVIGGVSVVVGELGEVGDARALLSAAHEIKARLGDAAVVLAGTSGEKVSPGRRLLGRRGGARALGGGRHPAGCCHSWRRRRRQAGGGAGRGPGRRTDRRGPADRAHRRRKRPPVGPTKCESSPSIMAPPAAVVRSPTRPERSSGRSRRSRRPTRRPSPSPSTSTAPRWCSSACRSASTGTRAPRRWRPAASPSRSRIVVDVPVEVYDERLTTKLAAASRRAGSRAAEDSLAAAHLLDSYLLALEARR